ncbi:MAG: TonB-dependent receptor [Proteobacteria bacterium]|nr:TonB-dependent receptor [Pseudomonadota bacterium]
MRPRSLACLVVALCGACSAWAAVPAPTLPALAADIEPQSLAGALSAFAAATGFNVPWPPEADALHSPGALAGSPPASALRQLLHCTGLRFEFLNARTVSIRPASTPDPACREDPGQALPLAEVTVTTTRWEQRVMEAPLDKVEWDAARAEASGVKGIADIAALNPGVSFDFFSSVGSGIFTDLVIRGVSDRHGSATGIYFDDIPLPAARSNTFGRALPPFFDMSKFEILRGPQGTLLGGNTQGGAVRFTPNEPSLAAFSGVARAEWAVSELGKPSYEVGAAAGGPLVPAVLGFRISAWQRSDGGYVNRVDALPDFTAPYPVVEANSNRTTTQSVRVALTWAPLSTLQLTPSFSYVSSHAPDSPAFFTYISNPGAGELNNGSLIAQPFDDTYYIGSLRLIADLGAEQLDSRTSYYHRTGDLTVDDTESAKWGGWGNPLGDAFPTEPGNVVATTTALRQSVFSQEIRVSSPEDGSATTWTAGLSYYRTEDLEAYRVTAAAIRIPLAPGIEYAGPLDAANSTPMLQTQLGLFARASHWLSQHFKLDGGLRLEREDYEAYQTEPVAFVTVPAPPTRYHPASGRNTVAAPRLSLVYASDRDHQYYVLAARGYSPAGVDAALPTCFENLAAYPTDTVWSYALGADLAFPAQHLALTATVFDANWNNGPALATNCLVTHIPGSAVSRGFELEGRGTVGGVLGRLEVSYVDAHYTQTSYQDGRVIVNEGDALGTPPLVASPWNVLASLEDTLALSGGASLTLRAEDAFHSRNPGPFYTQIPQPDGAPQDLYAPGLDSNPSVNLLNLRVTLDLRGPSPVPQLCHCSADATQGLALSLFLNNALDSQPTLLKRNKGADNVSNLFYATTFRPRTVGLAGTWRF